MTALRNVELLLHLKGFTNIATLTDTIRYISEFLKFYLHILVSKNTCFHNNRIPLKAGLFAKEMSICKSI